MTLWHRYSLILKTILLWIVYRIAKIIINLRNRPAAILIYPDYRLKRVAELVDFNKITHKKRVAIIRKLGATLIQQRYGMKLGISAPQIGINLRVMIVRGNVMFNPEWHPVKGQIEEMFESCYSVPKKIFKIQRAKYGWVKWTNIDGHLIKSKLTGFSAIIFQHELNHLNGICLPEISNSIEIENYEGDGIRRGNLD